MLATGRHPFPLPPRPRYGLVRWVAFVATFALLLLGAPARPARADDAGAPGAPGAAVDAADAGAPVVAAPAPVAAPVADAPPEPAAPQLAPTPAELARGAPIAKVVLAGNRRIAAEDIAGYLQQMRPGKTFTPEGLSKDVRELWDSGYFEDIEVDLTKKDDGVYLRILVRERPSIKAVEFTGNE